LAWQPTRNSSSPLYKREALTIARSDGSAQRFYSMSSQILEERKEYYEVLERTQGGSADITKWITWFLGCLDRAIEQSNLITSSALEKQMFWKALKQGKVSLNDRQTKALNKLFSGFDGEVDERQMDEVFHRYLRPPSVIPFSISSFWGPRFLCR
jgi:Fic family protein